MTHDAIYHLNGVCKRHRSGFTLDVPHLEIKSGEVIGLLGPTGSGKSTLLRVLAGLEEQVSGEIRFLGSAFAPPQISLRLRRSIAMVHQHPLLLTGSVRKNVEYGLRLRQARNQYERVDEALERLRLSDIASQMVGTLSGGQAQLVALARSLVLAPQVLLLDEPTAHLDPAHVELAEQTIRHYQREHQITFVWATHNLFQVRRVADRSMLLLNGELVEVGATEVLFTTPSNPRTLDFLQGRMVY